MFRRKLRYYFARTQKPEKKHLPPSKFTTFLCVIMIGLTLFFAVMFYFELQLRPVATAVGTTQAINLLTSTITTAFSEQETDYSVFTTIERSQTGEITALTTDMTALNQMRNTITEQVLTAVDGVDISVIEVPLGSLFSMELLWAKGPTIKARSMTVGTVSAEFESNFSQAGINQTLHRIYLHVTVPITLLLAGDTVETEITTKLCVSETVIVGTVPNTNLQLPTLTY